ncbi:MAG TPA: hypothetical protein VM492_16610 [Sumerlaeia bacterium]|nr:hypothetical protein [Sumerlaeia bacterium]
MTLQVHAIPAVSVGLGDIGWDDDTYLLRYGRPVRASELDASLERVGMLNPPLLIRGKTGAAIVCGFARLEAWRRLGRKSVQARVVAAGAASEEELLVAAIDDNEVAGGRRLNVIEQAMALEKLADWVGPERTIQAYLPRLGHKPSRATFEKLLGYRSLPKGVQVALADGRLGEGMLPTLRLLEPAEQELLLACMGTLRMSAGTRRNFAREAAEICRRDRVSLTDLLAEADFDPAVAPLPGETPHVRAALLAWMRKRRYPILHQIESDYAAAHVELELCDALTLRHPKDFEGDEFHLEARLRNVEDLRKVVGLLADRLEKRRALFGKMFETRWRE